MSTGSDPPAPVYINPIPPTIRLTEENFGDVADFTCHILGQDEKPWEQVLRDWITNRGPSGALAAIRIGEEVFLYFDEGRLVGYGSIGIEDFRDETTGETIGQLYVLPYLAVHSNYRSQKGPPAERWGRRILGGLIEEVERRGKLAHLLLYVDPANPARQHFYPLFGFVERDTIWTDPVDGRQWVMMLRKIPLRAE